MYWLRQQRVLLSVCAGAPRQSDIPRLGRRPIHPLERGTSKSPLEQSTPPNGGRRGVATLCFGSDFKCSNCRVASHTMPCILLQPLRRTSQGALSRDHCLLTILQPRLTPEFCPVLLREQSPQHQVTSRDQDEAMQRARELLPQLELSSALSCAKQLLPSVRHVPQTNV